MAGAFGYADAMRAAPAITMITGTVDDGMPLSNLYDDQPGVRTRFNGSPVRFVVDFGASITAGLIILGNTTLDETGVVRFYGSLTDPTGFAAEIMNESVVTTNASFCRGQAALLLSADVSFRYLRIHIENAPGGVADVGFLAVFPTLRLNNGMAFGAFEGRLPTGTYDQNAFTGAEFPVPGLTAPRVARFTLPTLRTTEFYGTLRDMLDGLTIASNVAWVPETTLSALELNRRTLFGRLLNPGQEYGITRDRPLLGTTSFAIRERI
ncbi:hypothetical protein [Falsiroseomonas tokyonensis]|uniref:F5/8 type C domain-containing protein n=1 Tax=Falsiroseomonas tokyonensis TaxID=430521 RepID=A0ABV7C1H5_9PROT|nr:hypothetical protein [Falsiroseomonas tokyonensis]MBU8540803.1 hypothetical protein [Falsiroseomonas tokyonensis]